MDCTACCFCHCQHSGVDLGSSFSSNHISILLSDCTFDTIVVLEVILLYVRLYAVASRLSVCLPYVRMSCSASWNYRQCFYAVLYLSHPLTSLQNFTHLGWPENGLLKRLCYCRDGAVEAVSGWRPWALWRLLHNSVQRSLDMFAVRLHCLCRLLWHRPAMWEHHHQLTGAE